MRITSARQKSTRPASTLEREVAHRVVAQISYTFVHGQNLIRARDVNLPPPTDVQYPIFDSSGVNVLGYGIGRDILHMAIQFFTDVSVPAMHQSAGAADPATGIDQCFRERGIKRVSRRHVVD